MKALPTIMLVALLITPLVRAQDLGSPIGTSQRYDIFLKNGIVFRSVMLEFGSDEMLVLNLGDGQIVTAFPNELKRLQVSRKTKRQSYYEKIGRRNFFTIIEVGLMSARNQGGGAAIALSAQSVNGHRFKEYLHLGLGIGIELWEGYRTVPLFVDLRGDIPGLERVMPYYYGNVGYSFAWSRYRFDEIGGGLNYGFGVGLKFPANKKAWLLSLGHRSQYLTTESGNFERLGWEDKEQRKLRRLVCGFGLTF